MKVLSLLFILVISSSCAKVSYLAEQGVGQLKLQFKGKPNEELLADPNIKDEWKQKIRLVEAYKKYFYEYFNMKPTTIYSKTSILEGDAVTYLVIASAHQNIKPHEFYFPIFGNFPYIGFFSESSAKSFAQNLQEDENLVTWIRPVYAYSTLGNLEDRILSSFFHYGDVELAELIFHELFHTIFFIKNDVDLNENLAQYFSARIMPTYFGPSTEFIKYQRIEHIKKKLYQKIVEKVKVLNEEFNKLGKQLTDQKADELTKNFSEGVLIPALKQICADEGLTEEECELKKEWNQARLAALLTYEEEQQFLEALQIKLKLENLEFFRWIKAKYKKFEKQSEIDNFTDYLKKYL
jgi:hypothetical protein